MPRAARTCTRCPAVITSGSRCANCAKPSATARGYGTEHQRFRTAVLCRDPICTDCHSAWSTIADHYPLSRAELLDAGLDPNDPERGRGLCKRCHDKHTAREQPGGWAAQG